MVAVWLIPACFATALAYATVGLAGGSTYLALLALSGTDHESMRVTALLLNLIVSAGGFYHYRRAGHFEARLLVPFALASIPAAFAAGLVALPKTLFFGLLSVSLFVSGIRMIFWREPLLKPRPVSWNMAWRWGPPVGAVLGLLAGLVGIGGGIFLGPVLILMGWANGKRAAAVASAFILVNSLAGLAAHTARGNLPEAGMWPLALAVLVGGQIGSRLGAGRLSPRALEFGFGVMVLSVSLNLAWKVLA